MDLQGLCGFMGIYIWIYIYMGLQGLYEFKVTP